MTILALMLWAVTQPAAAQQPRLIDVEPFDRLTLKVNNENKDDEAKRILKLRPLELKKRRPLKRGDDNDKLRVRLSDRSEQQYEVAWKFVEKLELYEELVLQEVAGLVEKQKFDEAYEYYQFLEARDASFPGVAAGYQDCLFAEATSWREQGETDQALGLLNEVHRRNPKYEGLEVALGEVVDALVARRLEAAQFAAVRELLKELESKFKEHPVVAERRQQVIDQAAAQLAIAQAAVKKNQYREAYIAASKAVAWWPELPKARQSLQWLQAKYRVLTVGVSELGPTEGDDQPAASSWAVRRQSRLINDPLVEASADAVAAGSHPSALGTWAIDGPKLSFTLHDKARWSDGARVTSYDVARRLQSLGNPASADYQPQWSEQVSLIKVPSAGQVEIELAGPRPTLLSLLRLPPERWNGPAAGAMAGTGLYRPASRTESEAVFQINPEHFSFEAQQASEVVERRYSSASGAVSALLAGDIVCVDRVAPWDLRLFARHKNLTVAPYALPTWHVLVPHPRRPLPAQGAFRRGIAAGLLPQRILEDRLFEVDADRGQSVAGEAAQSIPYDARLMLALLGAAQQAAPSGRDTPRIMITLAHPPTETARRASRAIQEQLQLGGNGPTVALRELESPATAADAGDWDLLYVEWEQFDAAIDLRRLLGADGLARAGNPWLHEALQKLGAAEDAEELRARRAAVMQIVNDDLPVIPLFLVKEHFAYRKGLENVGADSLTLYQNIERWKYEQK